MFKCGNCGHLGGKIGQPFPLFKGDIMLIVKKNEAQSIENDEKDQSLREIRANGKGYLTVGSVQQIRVGRDFKAPYICTVLIYNRDFVNIENLRIEDFKRLGYSSKAEYLAQDYNQRNPSPLRVRYSFVRVGRVLEYIEFVDWTPQTFADVWEWVGDCKEVTWGVDATLIYEGCDIEDLEEALSTIQSNLEELL